MSTEQNQPENNDAQKSGPPINGAWLAIGVGVGAAIGVAMGNIAVGVGVGAAIGAALSVAMKGK
jgi:hypothetical protein